MGLSLAPPSTLTLVRDLASEVWKYLVLLILKPQLKIISEFLKELFSIYFSVLIESLIMGYLQMISIIWGISDWGSLWSKGESEVLTLSLG